MTILRIQDQGYFGSEKGKLLKYVVTYSDTQEELTLHVTKFDTGDGVFLQNFEPDNHKFLLENYASQFE